MASTETSTTSRVSPPSPCSRRSIWPAWSRTMGGAIAATRENAASASVAGTVSGPS